MSEVNAVKMPLYNTSDPTLWFAMCESTFVLATPKPITESLTKYNYIIAHLPPDLHYVFMCSDVTDPYAQIKNKLKSFRGFPAGDSETPFGGRIRFSKTFRAIAKHEMECRIFEC
ncbi:transposon Ty3-G Gag-Pol polyprotein [Trichonephila clavata]|uniref:Transposon Ty3-G Gag-Pol polyprotein n=1 Tax=Trichonephila clavata TaxID=2740835 RepID=A0A8X6KNI5_TRICU|nr:transposon Ty3-G Gag-Pol polyprotein [Trichonephila clavata]